MVNWTFVDYKVPGADKPYREGACLSTDQKPGADTVLNGSKLLELDSGSLYMFDAENDRWLAWNGGGGEGGATAIVGSAVVGTATAG